MKSKEYKIELDSLWIEIVDAVKEKVLEFSGKIEENGFVELDGRYHHYSPWNGGEDVIYAVDLTRAYIDDGSEGFTTMFEDLQVGNLIGILEDLENKNEECNSGKIAIC